MQGATIIGTGFALPEKTELSSDFDTRLGLPSGELERLTGVRARQVCGPEESQVSLAVAACEHALADAGAGPESIDLIVSAAAVPYQPIPATAPALQRALGIADGAAFAFDINSTCLGFLSALECVDGLLAAGRYRRALVVSSEIASRALPWETAPDVAGLFGDGAGAAVVEPGAGHIAATGFETHASAYEACGIGAGGTRIDFHAEPEAFAAKSYFEMDGRALFRLSSRHFAGFVERVIAQAGWTRGDVDLVVPHQASPAGLAHMVRQCGFESGRVVDISAAHGNQIAASIPICLSMARADGRAPSGARVLMLGTSAGVSFGGVAMVV